MKKIIVLLLSLCMLASLYGCGKKALVEKKYEAAFSNALEYMQNSPPFERVREIEPERVEVEEGLIEVLLELARFRAKDGCAGLLDESDWLFTIYGKAGDSISIVCDSESGEVLSYIPPID